MAKLTMPQMGFDMQEGTLVRWLKRAGDPVKRGEAVAEIETDKAVVEIESFHDGVVKELLVAEGTTVPVGQPIAVIDAGDEETSAETAPAEAAPSETAPAGEAAPAPGAPGGTQTATGTTPEAAPVASVASPAAPPAAATPAAVASPEVPAVSRRIKASPLARRLAAEHGVNLAALSGSGPGGRIVKRDVMAAVEAKAAAPAAAPATVAPSKGAPPDRVVSVSRMRQTIARRLSESKQQAPHFYVTAAIAMDEALALRAQLKALGPEGAVSVNDLVLKATAIALTRHPHLNASWEDGHIRLHGAIHLAVAVALDDGLITPVIRDCQAKSLVQIAREAKELAEAARAGRLKPEQYQGGTFTVSNLGMFGVEEFSAIINPPQAAILAVGAVTEQPVVRNGQVTVARMMRVTVSADHRVTDGAQVARFLQDLKAVLESPLRLLV
ncbi:MAG: pyruvate dehydrogenase complex dihydrolipoamide acetyltransferase [Firmicutes bacterium]|nr:pyruvate dehydrogenase complex dihydrolipoamide acetyltransferase [Bacillota bacterium]